jgi:TolB-like protein
MATSYDLGPFRLDGEAQILFRGAEPVALGERAVALLRVLVEHAGAPVSKDALIEAAWPGVVVEESNLTVQVAALRRVLGEAAGGERWIETLQRRGYRYVGPVGATPAGGRADGAAAAPPPALALPDRPSVAVLPFANLSGDLDQEYFADGMVEDIITGLARIKWLFVVARNSSFTYKGRAVNVTEVGRELGVRYVLEGSVRRAGARVRIAAQLVEAETGVHVWAERYDRPFDDIFALQDEITLSVVGAIEPSLRDAEIERVKRKRPENLDAYDLVLRAIPHVYVATPEGAAKALPLLVQALAIEPDYAGAHGQLAFCHESLFVRGGYREEDRTAAIRHARAAIAQGRDDATALALAGLVLALVEHDRAAAFEAFEQARSLSPSSSLALFFGSVVFGYAAEAERAIDWGARALRISPFDRLSYAAHHGTALGHFLRGRYEEAANAGRRAAQSNPNFSFSQAMSIAPLVRLGRLDEARAAAARVLALQPSFSISGFCAAIAVAPVLAAPLTAAWREAGLPP